MYFSEQIMVTQTIRNLFCSQINFSSLGPLILIGASLVPVSETWITIRYVDTEKVRKHEKDKLRIVDFSDLNFNASDWCVPKQTLLEMILDTDGSGYVDRLKYKVCLNISEIERFETLSELRSIFRRREKADKLMAGIIKRLSDEEESKKEVLTDHNFNFTVEIAPCYQYVTELFSKYCMDVKLNPYMRTYRYLFVHSCEVEWLNIFKIQAVFQIGCFFKKKLVDIL